MRRADDVVVAAQPRSRSSYWSGGSPVTSTSASKGPSTVKNACRCEADVATDHVIFADDGPAGDSSVAGMTPPSWRTRASAHRSTISSGRRPDREPANSAIRRPAGRTDRLRARGGSPRCRNRSSDRRRSTRRAATAGLRGDWSGPCRATAGAPEGPRREHIWFRPSMGLPRCRLT